MTGASVEARDRFDLLAHLDVVWRWKWLVVLGVLAGTVVAGLVGVLTPKTYVVGATIETGDLSEERLKAVDRLVARLQAGAPLPGGERSPIPVTIQFRRPSVIELGTETRSPAKVAQALERAATAIVGELDRLLRLEQERDQTMQRLADDLRKTVDRLPAADRVAPRSADETVARAVALLALQRLALDPPNPRPARIVSAPQIPTAPVRPRLRVNLAVGFVLGLVASLFLAFLVEYVRQARGPVRAGAAPGPSRG